MRREPGEVAPDCVNRHSALPIADSAALGRQTEGRLPFLEAGLFGCKILDSEQRPAVLKDENINGSIYVLNPIKRFRKAVTPKPIRYGATYRRRSQSVRAFTKASTTRRFRPICMNSTVNPVCCWQTSGRSSFWEAANRPPSHPLQSNNAGHSRSLRVRSSMGAGKARSRSEAPTRVPGALAPGSPVLALLESVRIL